MTGSAHQSSFLTIPGRHPLRVDENTVALWHFNVNYKDALRGIDAVAWHSSNYGIDRYEGRFGSGSLYLARKSNNTTSFNRFGPIQFGMWSSSNGASSVNISSGGGTYTSGQSTEFYDRGYDYTGVAVNWRVPADSGTVKRAAAAIGLPNIHNAGFNDEGENWVYRAYTNAVDGDIRMVESSVGDIWHYVSGNRYMIFSAYVRVEEMSKTTAAFAGGLWVAVYNSSDALINATPIASSNPAGWRYATDGTYKASSIPVIGVEPYQFGLGNRCSMSGWERLWVIVRLPADAYRVRMAMSFANWGQARGAVRFTMPMMEDISDNIRGTFPVDDNVATMLRPPAGIKSGWNAASDQRIAYPSWPLIETFKTNQWTISFWVKLNGVNLDSHYRPLLTIDNSPARQGLAQGAMTTTQYYDVNRFLLMFDYGGATYPLSLGMFWGDATNTDYLGTSICQMPNVWTHYAITRNGTTYKIYMNGKEVASKVSTSGTPADFGKMSMYLGNWKGNLEASLNGFINELRFDKVCRTPEEISAWARMDTPFLPRGNAACDNLTHRDVPIELPPEPVLWYPMDSIDSGLCKDRSGGGRDATVSAGIAVVAGANGGKAYDSFSTTRRVSRTLDTTINDLFGPNKSFSYTIWWKHNYGWGNRALWMGNNVDGSGKYPINLWHGGNSGSPTGPISVYLYDGTTTYTLSGGGGTYGYASRGFWNHITVVRDAENNEGRLYINGQLIHTLTVPGAADFRPGTTNTSFFMGSVPFDATYYTVGSLDDFQLFSQALTTEQVNWLVGL